MFIGEAPGKTENLIGKPFLGRSGKLLDKMTKEVYEEVGRTPSFGVTNILSCIPWEKTDDGTKTVRPPTPEEAKACSTRLLETIKIADPMAIVLLGRSAEAYANTLPPVPVLCLQHPAYILRKGGKGEPYDRFVATLSNFLKDNL